MLEDWRDPVPLPWAGSAWVDFICNIHVIRHATILMKHVWWGTRVRLDWSSWHLYTGFSRPWFHFITLLFRRGTQSQVSPRSGMCKLENYDSTSIRETSSCNRWQLTPRSTSGHGEKNKAPWYADPYVGHPSQSFPLKLGFLEKRGQGWWVTSEEEYFLDATGPVHLKSLRGCHGIHGPVQGHAWGHTRMEGGVGKQEVPHPS